MLLLGENDSFELQDFDAGLAETKLKERFAVIPLLCDRLYNKLQHNLKVFYQEKSGTNEK